MSLISIKRAHHSTVAEARKTADKIAAKLGKEYELRSHWDGDVLHFDRSGLHGTLAVGSKDIHVEVKLGLLMAAFRGPIQSAMETQLDSLLKASATSAKAAAKPASKPAEKATSKAKT